MSTPSILCTMPGRYGDILWALPTVRALSEAYGTPVDLAIPGEYAGIAPLIQGQDYVRTCWVRADWQVQQTAPITPRTPPTGWGVRYDAEYHLGYEAWPEGMLATDVYRRAFNHYRQYAPAHGRYPALDLTRPWITPVHAVLPAGVDATAGVWVAWSEEWFELKVGILVALAARFPDLPFWWLRPWGGRYDEVDYTCLHATGTQTHRLGPNVAMVRSDWRGTAHLAAHQGVYLGCLSSQWVLANALGKRVVAVEPNEHRWHPVFWRDAPGNRLVRGTDGRPTFDARHVGDALEEVLDGRTER